MFSLGRELHYWLYSEPTDMRKSFHMLSGLVRDKIGGNWLKIDYITKSYTYEGYGEGDF